MTNQLDTVVPPDLLAMGMEMRAFVLSVSLIIGIVQRASSFTAPVVVTTRPRPNEILLVKKTDGRAQCRTTAGRDRPRCFLFFERRQLRQSSSLPDEEIDNLGKPTVLFPFTLTNTQGDGSEEVLTIRTLEKPDLQTVVPMCVKEFGTSGEMSPFPWRNLNRNTLQAWFDDLIFGPLVGMSFEMKILQRDKEPRNDFVLCLERSNNQGSPSEVVGIVELSLQPLDPHRNPPPVPLPLWYKELYSQTNSVPAPNGWVTNLLIDESHRGKGYAKILMAAVEGLAKSWGCSSISLHVDSDRVSGKVPQKLYQKLGYQPVLTSTNKDDATFDVVAAKDENNNNRMDWGWMGGSNPVQSGLYMVDGVLLLFMRKELVSQ